MFTALKYVKHYVLEILLVQLLSRNKSKPTVSVTFSHRPVLNMEFGWSIIQEGWLSPMKHASVSAISLRHILGSPGLSQGRP